jgi:hypothetical protein
MTDTSSRNWSLMFLAAAVFNFAMGGPIFFASSWSYQLAYEAPSSESTLRFWGDFGFSVLLIGVGYLMVSRALCESSGFPCFSDSPHAVLRFTHKSVSGFGSIENRGCDADARMPLSLTRKPRLRSAPGAVCCSSTAGAERAPDKLFA